MHINKVIIHSFGKIEDKEIIFKKQINVLYGDNESGKSTVLAFIKACLYGLSSRGKMSDRKRYTPWGKESFGGQIYFNFKGKDYRYICQFGTSKRQDSGLLYDVISGDQVPLPLGLSLGEYLFSLSEGAFDASIFAPQLEGIIDISKDKEGQIVAMLASDQLEDRSINIVERRLKKALDTIKAPRSKNGLLDSLYEKEKKNQEAFDAFLIEENRLKNLNADIKEIEENLSHNLKKIKAYNASKTLSERDLILGTMKKIEELKEAILSQEKKKRIFYLPLSILFLAASLFSFFILENKYLAIIPLALALVCLYLLINEKKASLEGKLLEKEKEKEEAILKHILRDRKLDSLKMEWKEAASIGPSDIANIDDLIRIKEDQEDRLYTLRAKLSATRDDFDYSKLLEEKRETKKKVAFYEDTYKALSYAYETMQESYKSLQETFAPSISREIGKIFKKIRIGHETEIKINKDFELSLDEKEGYMHYLFYSGATIDQVYFAFRLALAKTLVKDLVLPLYLDEPFIQYDEKRLKNSLLYLLEFNKDHENQIVFSSSQERILAMVKNHGQVNIVKI